jgi:hypothetical protein
VPKDRTTAQDFAAADLILPSLGDPEEPLEPRLLACPLYAGIRFDPEDLHTFCLLERNRCKQADSVCG